MKIAEAILESDLQRLSKKSLVDICNELKLSPKGLQSELSGRIWAFLRENKNRKEAVLKEYEEMALCGKTSVTWYYLEGGATLKGSREKILAKARFNPFSKAVMPDTGKITESPILISAIEGQSKEEYYLRFVHKIGTINKFSGSQREVIPITKVVTVYMNEDSNCIEIRTEANSAKKFASTIAGMIEQHTAITPRNIVDKDGKNIGAIADKLGGILTESTSKPETNIGDISGQETKNLIAIITAIDAYFLDDDIRSLEGNLQAAKQELDLAQGTLFTTMFLSGLEKVGLGGKSDLRDHAFFNYLKPHVQQQGGYINFSIGEIPFAENCTIRVGVTTNSIQFLTSATEKAVKYVRENVIIL